MPSSGIGAGGRRAAAARRPRPTALGAGLAARAAVDSIFRPMTMPRRAARRAAPPLRRQHDHAAACARRPPVVAGGSVASVGDGGRSPRASRHRPTVPARCGCRRGRGADSTAAGVVLEPAVGGVIQDRTRPPDCDHRSTSPASSLTASANSRQLLNRSAGLVASARTNTPSRRASSGRWSLSFGGVPLNSSRSAAAGEILGRRRTGQQVKGGGRQRVLVGAPDRCRRPSTVRVRRSRPCRPEH